jgi:hypothetical protein
MDPNALARNLVHDRRGAADGQSAAVVRNICSDNGGASFDPPQSIFIGRRGTDIGTFFANATGKSAAIGRQMPLPGFVCQLLLPAHESPDCNWSR